MFVVAVDLDGTIDAAPQVYAKLMQEWRGDGNTVTILTGNPTATPGYLSQLGVTSESYDQIVQLPAHTLPEEKAAWCKANDVNVVIDNKAANCMACVAAGVTVAFLPVTAETTTKIQRALLRRAQRLLDS